MIQSSFQKFGVWMDGLKKSRQALIFLIGLDLVMAIASNIVDWHWLMSVEWYLRPFAPICSMFPGALAIWFIIYLTRKKVPAWFTAFIFIGIVSYGVMAWIYYPFYMVFIDFHWRLPGNMLWVTIYALQSLIIVSELKPIKIHQFALIISYYLFKDFSDRYLGSFIDASQPGFPEWLKDFFGMSILTLHVAAFALAARIMQKKARKEEPMIPAEEPVKQEA